VLLCGQLAGADDALRIAAAITTALEQPFELGRRSVHVTCCIGIAVHVHAGDRADAATLVRNAEAALRSAKAGGSARVCVFDPRLHDEALARLDMEVALRAAIAAEELLVHYQPIVGLPNGDLRGVEALVRWQRPDIGLVPPMDFIPLAEESGLIGELGQWVLSTAMQDAARWKAAGLVGDDFVLSVNISAHQLTSGELPGIVRGLLAEWTLAPDQLWMEITETAVVSDPQVGRAQIRALSALGVRVAIDDFGVGQSSLDQLVHSLPVEILKLDRSFTAHLSDWRERAVVAAIAPMAQSLQMIAVAEGVETTGQADELAQLGYPLAQGFLFGRPVDCEAMAQRLRGSAMPVVD
jgi:predicted signal transduction protein with EAL and GGDEF domain